MQNKLLITLITYLFLTANVFAAGSGGDGGDSGGSGKVKTEYDKAVSHIKIAKTINTPAKIDQVKYASSFKRAGLNSSVVGKKIRYDSGTKMTPPIYPKKVLKAYKVDR